MVNTIKAEYIDGKWKFECLEHDVPISWTETVQFNSVITVMLNHCGDHHTGKPMKVQRITSRFGPAYAHVYTAKAKNESDFPAVHSR
jgi:hypothetical protein